jgi:hypothetical protein
LDRGPTGSQPNVAGHSRRDVQDPEDARYPYLPGAALLADGIDFTLPLKGIAPALTKLVGPATTDG